MNDKYAFPIPANEPHHPGTTGMTLRDYFAAKAMQGAASNHGYNIRERAEWAYNQADAMLKAREQQ